MIIEEHYKKSMDMEWAKDGRDGKLYIVQARPETVQSRRNLKVLEENIVKPYGVILATGPTGSGKTVMALAIAAELGRKTLITVNKERLMEQWIEEIKDKLDNLKIKYVKIVVLE